MNFVCCEIGCKIEVPHDHGSVFGLGSSPRPAIIYRVEDENAEVRDPDTGEVIFPARKAPFKVINGSRP